MSLSNELLRHVKNIVHDRGLESRLQWIAELIRHELAKHRAKTRPDEMLAGTPTLIYRGDRERVRQQLTSTQGDFLKDEQSLEVPIVQGTAIRLRDLSDAIRKVRGVQQVRLTITRALLPPLHE